MPESEIRALCNQIAGEAKAISEGCGDVASIRANQAAAGGSPSSEVADRLADMGLQHLENLQQLVILLTSSMTAAIPQQEEGTDGGGDGKK